MIGAWKTGLVALTFALMPAIASAQRACPEGRTASGECVNAGLAESMRESGVIYSQPKLSNTTYPVLPALDYTFRYPYQLNPYQLPPRAAGGR